MKKILITGVSGFVGFHLSEILKQSNEYEVYGTKLPFEKCDLKNVNILNMDLTNNEEVQQIISDINPEYVIHLAAQSSVKFSWENPSKTTEINIIGTINLLESIRKSNINARILLIGSSEEYGSSFKQFPSPKEDCKCMPENIYALTKSFQNSLGTIYAKAYNMNIVMTRSFNHFGINQSPMFVISDFCKQVAEIELGKREPTIYVGNLDASRDFLNVKDVVKAYLLLLEKGTPSETYNIGSGKSYKIKDILNEIISLSNLKIDVKVDPNKYRKLDIEETVADISKIKEELNWEPKEDMHMGLKLVLDYWRNELSNKL